jgi:hypothetical protein
MPINFTGILSSTLLNALIGGAYVSHWRPPKDPDMFFGALILSTVSLVLFRKEERWARSQALASQRLQLEV